jgi:hypothetical protein
VIEAVTTSKEQKMLTRGSLMVGVVLAVAVASTGCASSGKVRMSSAKRCQAHGGTYDTTAKSCAYAATTKTAAQSCQSEGGYYDTAADVCEIGQE